MASYAEEAAATLVSHDGSMLLFRLCRQVVADRAPSNRAENSMALADEVACDRTDSGAFQATCCLCGACERGEGYGQYSENCFRFHCFFRGFRLRFPVPVVHRAASLPHVAKVFENSGVCKQTKAPRRTEALESSGSLSL